MISKEDFAAIDAEVCKIENWRDQIMLGTFICAVCKGRSCSCVIEPSFSIAWLNADIAIYERKIRSIRQNCAKIVHDFYIKPIETKIQKIRRRISRLERMTPRVGKPVIALK